MNGWHALLAIVIALGYIIGNLLLLHDSARYVERFTRRSEHDKSSPTDQNAEAGDKPGLR